MIDPYKFDELKQTVGYTKKIHNAALQLINKLNLTQNSIAWKEVWKNYRQNGFEYKGPNYATEFNSLVVACKEFEAVVNAQEKIIQEMQFQNTKKETEEKKSSKLETKPKRGRPKKKIDQS